MSTHCFSLNIPLLALLCLSNSQVTGAVLPAMLVLVSFGAALVFRQWVRRLFTAPLGSGYTDFIGDTVIVTQTIPVHGLGRVQYRGTDWSARTAVGKTHKRGDGLTIRRVEGIVLVVE